MRDVDLSRIPDVRDHLVLHECCVQDGDFLLRVDVFLKSANPSKSKSSIDQCNCKVHLKAHLENESLKEKRKQKGVYLVNVKCL